MHIFILKLFPSSRPPFASTHRHWEMEARGPFSCHRAEDGGRETVLNEAWQGLGEQPTSTPHPPEKETYPFPLGGVQVKTKPTSKTHRPWSGADECVGGRGRCGPSPATY